MHYVIRALTLPLAAAIVLGGCSPKTTEELDAQQKSDREKLAAKQDAETKKMDAKEAKAAQELDDLKTAAAATIERAKKDDASFEKYFSSAVGYAVFPKVSKGGLVVGGAGGDGVVYERRSVLRDRVIGTAVLAQGSIGLQIGGQTFSEIVFFEDDATFENFKKSNVEFSGQASGVAGGEGAGEVAKYENGVAIFVFGQKGLMGEASIGGQKFTFTPLP